MRSLFHVHPAKSVAHPSRARRLVGKLRGLIGFFGAPTAWAFQMMVSEGLSSYACYPHRVALTDPIWEWLEPALAGISLISFGAALFCTAVAWLSWRRSRHETTGSKEEAIEVGEGRTRFISLISVYSSGLFLIAILFSACALLLVPPCS